jgi:hypothetical protein
LKGLQYVPRVIVTDKLRSFGVAQRSLLPNVEHHAFSVPTLPGDLASWASRCSALLLRPHNPDAINQYH